MFGHRVGLRGRARGVVCEREAAGNASRGARREVRESSRGAVERGRWKFSHRRCLCGRRRWKGERRLHLPSAPPRRPGFCGGVRRPRLPSGRGRRGARATNLPVRAGGTSRCLEQRTLSVSPRSVTLDQAADVLWFSLLGLGAWRRTGERYLIL